MRTVANDPGLRRRDFLLGSVAHFGKRRVRPNIIVMLADDLGYGDLGCYGGTNLTPNIDGLARRGVRFTNFHSGASVCTPSRAALLTGRYANKVGIPVVLFPRDQYGISAAPTFADSAKLRRYRAGMAGKWHVGHADRKYHPASKGFSDFSEWAPWSNDMGYLPILRGSDTIDDATDKAEFLTRRFADRSIEFIESAGKDEPFLLYTAFIAPHWPPKASPDFAGATGRGPHADTITELDFHVGRMLRALRDNGLEENTLVIITSDNGALRDPNLPGNMQGSNGILSGGKFFLGEGGIRVPCIASWPGHAPEAAVCDEFVSAMDVAPMIRRLTGGAARGQPADFDGIDMSPALWGGALERQSPILFFEAETVRASIGRLSDERTGKGFLAKARYDRGSPPRLYDIGSDPGERNDIALEYPAVIERMTALARRELETFPQSTRDANRGF